MSDIVLETKNLGISFGGLKAVSGVNLQVPNSTQSPSLFALKMSVPSLMDQWPLSSVPPLKDPGHSPAVDLV